MYRLNTLQLQKVVRYYDTTIIWYTTRYNTLQVNGRIVAPPNIKQFRKIGTSPGKNNEGSETAQIKITLTPIVMKVGLLGHHKTII